MSWESAATRATGAAPVTGRERRIAHGLGAVLASQIINTFGQILLVPLFLSSWSSTAYGEWLALSAAVTFLASADFGMASAARNMLLAAWARRDHDDYARLQSAALLFYIALAAVITLAAAVAVQLIPIRRLLGIVELSSATVCWVVLVLTARTMWSMPASQIWNVYRNTGNLAVTQWMWNLQLGGMMAITAVVLFLRGGPLEVAAWSSLSLVATVAIAWLTLLRSEYRPFLPVLRFAEWSAIRELLVPTVYFGVILLAMTSSLHGPVLMASGALGGAAVALLVTTRTLANLIRQLVQSVVEAVWPEITRLDAAGDTQTLRTTHRFLVAACAAAAAAAGGALWFQGAAIINVWTGGRLTADPALLRACLACVYLQSPWIASSTLALASNRHGSVAAAYAMACIVTLLATILLLPVIGLVAVPVATIVGEASVCYHLVIRQSCRALDEPYKPFAVRLWTGVAATGTAALVLGWAGDQFASGPLVLRFALVAFASLSGAVTAATVVLLRKSDRTHLALLLTARWNIGAPEPGEAHGES